MIKKIDLPINASLDIATPASLICTKIRGLNGFLTLFEYSTKPKWNGGLFIYFRWEQNKAKLKARKSCARSRMFLLRSFKYYLGRL